MKEDRRLLYVFIFLNACFISYQANAQTFHLSDGVHYAVTSRCLICKSNGADSMRLLFEAVGFTSVQLAYHNAVVLLDRASLDSGYQYLVKATADNAEGNDTLFNTANFLKAKLLLYKNLFSEALSISLPLLEHPKTDDVITENICTNIAETYLQESRFAESLKYFSLWEAKYKSFSNANSIKSVYCNTALCYLHTNDYKNASFYFAKSVAIAEQLKDTLGLAILYENIANQYYNQYQDAEARNYFKKGLFFAGRSNDLTVERNVYLSLAVLEESHKNYFIALDYRKKFEMLNDSIYNRDNVYNLVENEKKLAVKEKEDKVQLMMQSNKIQKQQLYLSSVLAVAFLSFFMFAFFAYRQKNKQNQIITAQREELDALNHTKDQLFSVVAHDLRSPIQTMKAALSKLRIALSDNNISQAEHQAGQIESISNGTYSLLNNLLYWALSQTGQLHFAKEKLNVYRLVEQVYFDYAPMAAAKNITLQNHVPENIYCSGDLNTVKVILRNLIDNAIKFSGSDTSVMTSGHEKDGECVVSICDGGKGIDAEVVEALIDKYTKRVSIAQSQSTGIGLWLVKTMAERNGGYLQIEPKRKGTEIKIHLPLYRNHEQTANIDC